jgi:trans-aconitate 2-methyltransferase
VTVTQTSWDPAQYGKFADERLRPACDLLARVPLEAPHVAYDLGCGTGNVTPLMVGRWPGAEMVGIDSSAAMLDKARRAHGGITWIEADIASWRASKPADLLFANASLQWLDDHAALFPRLVAQLNPGGVLAVQMPRNFEAPSHVCMREAARAGAWRDKLARARLPSPVADPVPITILSRLMRRDSTSGRPNICISWRATTPSSHGPVERD